MSTISVKKHFAAGHRILGLIDEGEKCRNIHGHTFHVTWTFDQDEDKWPPEIEFGKLKRYLEHIKYNFDHTFILDESDDFVYYLRTNMLRYRTLDGPPTTERIAAEIAKMTIEHLTETRKDCWDKDVAPIAPNAKLISVELCEGPENVATWLNPAYATPHYKHGYVTPGVTGIAPSIGGFTYGAGGSGTAVSS